MPLLKDMRSMFRRKTKPVALDLTGTQAEGLTSFDEAPPRVPDSAIEAKPGRGRSLDASRSYEEVMGLVRRIGDHLESQSERTDRLLSLMDRLPQALDALPEINRQNARLLDALHDQFAQSKSREETLNATLSTLTEASGRQTEVLGLVHQQAESNREAASHLTDSIGSLHQALSDLAGSNTHTADVLSRMADATSAREEALSGALLKTQRWIMAGVVCCGGASLIALIVAVIALTG